MASLTKHRVTIDRAQDALESRLLHFELALLGDSVEQKDRMRQEVGDALDALVQAVDAFKQEYLLTGSQEEPIREQSL